MKKVIKLFTKNLHIIKNELFAHSTPLGSLKILPLLTPNFIRGYPYSTPLGS